MTRSVRLVPGRPRVTEASYRGPVHGPPWWPATEYMAALHNGGMDADNPSWRHNLCRHNPLIFGLIYFGDTLLRHHSDGEIHLSDLHCDIARWGRRWAEPNLAAYAERVSFIGPRASAKSSWLCVVVPVWAMAFQHRRFVALFGNTSKQIATTHFANIRRAFKGNDLLRHDFPNLCQSLDGPGTDTADTYQSRNRTILVARGLDESTLGLNINGQRPDSILLDDPEKDEGNFSVRQKTKRLATLRQGILGMSPRAVVGWAGTTTAHGSLAHDLVRHAVGELTASWIAETGFQVRYYPAIMTDPHGAERSLWPAEWDLAWLRAQRGISDFELNFMNRPLSPSGALWQPHHFLYDIPAGWDISWRIMYIDPAVTSNATSDFTGLAVGGYAANARGIAIEHANAVRVTPEGLLRNVVSALDAYPDIREVFVEANNGHDYLTHALEPVLHRIKLRTPSAHESKSVRFNAAFRHYERGRVRHRQQFRLPEDQMMAFPDATVNDDGADAIAGLVNELAKRMPVEKIGKK